MVDKNGNYNLTPKGRASLRAHIKVTKPHLYTRGPVTAEGKARVRFNGLKHGKCSRTAKLKRYCRWLQQRYFAADDPKDAANLKAQWVSKLEELRAWQLSTGEAPTPPRRLPKAKQAKAITQHQDAIDWPLWVPLEQAAKAIEYSNGGLRRLAGKHLVVQGLAICANRNFPFSGIAKWYIHVDVDPRLAAVKWHGKPFKAGLKRRK